MPELPEVETIRRDLQKKILHKQIKTVQVNKPKIVKNKTKQFIKSLENNKFTDIDRVGKLIMARLVDNSYLLVHLRMTGQLIYVFKDKVVAGGHNWPPVNELPNKHTHIVLSFSDGSQLFFNDLRQFGYMQLVDEKTKEIIKSRFGLEPLQLDFTLTNFSKLFKKKNTILKSFLLNQNIIAGLGNIYVDEVCFRARVLPIRKLNTITKEEIKRIYQACQYIINKAIINRGTTFSDYRDTDGLKGNFVKYLKVYGRAGDECVNCSKLITKIKLNGRGTHFCGYCQN